jgi:hypothetical protein
MDIITRKRGQAKKDFTFQPKTLARCACLCRAWVSRTLRFLLRSPAAAPSLPTRDRERGSGYLTDGGPRMRALAAAATAVAAPTPACLRFRLPLLPRAPRSGEFAPPSPSSPSPLLRPPPLAAEEHGRGDFWVGLVVSATRGLGFRVWRYRWR